MLHASWPLSSLTSILLLTICHVCTSLFSINTMWKWYVPHWLYFQHITPVLRDMLHWLPVRQRILYKVAATAFDCIRGTSPAYFKHICTPALDISGRAHLRSAERRDMLVPRIRTELGWRSFPVAAPTVWNSLSAHLRSTLISCRQLRDGLKSHLFADAYFWSSENIRYKSVMYLLTYCPKIVKPPQSLPLLMAERLLWSQPDSLANHVTARSISDWCGYMIGYRDCLSSKWTFRHLQ